ncbi:Uncharacterized protein OS=Blastopirellula marina DSM 3645 GN=DSM3645_16785 PE=4 SV=1 [Gemmata massiliana]|uniref:Carboxypeptidase regulatory-like domain-containing protein n=1 Tax=Gemmata massiliana TaxID=1210884 RepID=A0A6P2D4T5_9BACT|nr:carboxypeptidase-like regulatory domain-containing protein [Gemmata massiliana]VTR95455.1 Uncharacterized protein OS=Blastopirellula marina DSM 3645 GN=DSM3645_16785 PE=4 SV=1 [Gemmata massiliana]
MATSDRLEASGSRPSSALRTALLGVLLSAIAVGCSGSDTKLAPVEGTVTRHGRPIPHAQVIFVAEGDAGGPRATGVTDGSGKFRLTTDDGKDGAPIGRHRVCVIDTSAITDKMGLLSKQSVPENIAKHATTKSVNKGSSIPAQYGRPTDTPLRVDVRAGAQAIELQIH